MRRTVLLAAAALSGAAAAVVPALAADQDVQVADNSFTPASVTVAAGETVTFRPGGDNPHNVRFVDGQFEQPAEPTPAEDWPEAPPSRTFSAAGTYRYYCEAHGAAGTGMAGTVVVTSGQTTTTDPLPSPSPTPTPTVTPTPTPGPVEPVAISVRRARARFCTRRSRACRRPGVVLLLDAERATRVEGTVHRRPLRGGPRRRLGRLLFEVGAGPNTLRFRRTRENRRLRPGRYTVRLHSAQPVAGPTETVRFRVRAS